MLNFLLALLISVPSFACPVDLKVMESFMKRPRFKSMVVGGNGFKEKDFIGLIERFRIHADPLLKERGYGEVKYLTYWEVDEGNAFTSESENPKTAYFLFSGGLLRAPHMTKDGFLFAACHELGHHLGGFPKIPKQMWSSTEGQADYYATLKCMREILKNDPENAGAHELELPGAVKKRCEKIFAGDVDGVNICLRSTKAGEDAFRFLQNKELGKAENSLLNNWFFGSVEETILYYPDHACRALSAHRGAICPEAGELSDTDETVGACHKKNGNGFGARPRCWFRPGVE